MSSFIYGVVTGIGITTLGLTFAAAKGWLDSAADKERWWWEP